MNQLVLKARYISSESSLAFNEPIKNVKLEQLEKDIVKFTAFEKLTEDQLRIKVQVLMTIEQLKNLSNESFLNKSVGLGGQVELLVRSFESHT
ncbi:hypothetical protein [Vibrio aestuarianus]|uniref:Uncharacterized protein n=1 Tax=Vibrio aestuarianus TaxID=28171 RepID=A0ABM9FVI6_9VIBR|nr:hypothetical protein [Vibrio aestuarianus]EHH1227796.1 hypothetical protein [Vibrio vulnificus]EII3056857.1 hypothetical protein [Vibrio vulnificus]ELX4135121.1 hypothetical protein [Vibrio vulnificus]ELX4180581.1 hypothetical protein [Vibrio vulnificus]MDE1215474.1 hypothetical protein [Vibrio aestuarianus]